MKARKIAFCGRHHRVLVLVKTAKIVEMGIRRLKKVKRRKRRMRGIRTSIKASGQSLAAEGM